MMNPVEKAKQIEGLLDARREQFVRDNLMSSEFLEFLRINKEPFDRMITYYRCAIMEVETKFRVLDQEFSMRYERNPIESIKSRIKSTESLIVKVRNRNIPLNLQSIEQNITDIAGLRVICSFPEDIYMLADCLLNQDDVTLIQRKDYIASPKPSGYRSLHLIVEVPIFLQQEKRMMKVEVQLRTIAMDFWASLEHKLRYKKNIPDDMAAELAQELVECAQASAALDYKMQEIRNRILANEALDNTMHQMQGRSLPAKVLKRAAGPMLPPQQQQKTQAPAQPEAVQHRVLIKEPSRRFEEDEGTFLSAKGVQ